MGSSRDITTYMISHLGKTHHSAGLPHLLCGISAPSNPVETQAREAGASGEEGMESELSFID